MSRGRCVGAAIVACVLTANGGVFAETIWVPDDYATIQGAIDTAVDGDEIAVRPGTYNETIDFIGKAVRLYSTDGAEVTTIDATGLDAYGAVSCINGEGPDAVLDGFTITGSEREGAMVNWLSSPTVIDCIFTRNLFGGMSNRDSAPTIVRCVFVANESERWPSGGMYNEDSAPLVVACTFTLNRAANGGGMASHGGSPLVIGCIFRANHAVGDWPHSGAGGMFNLYSSPTVMSCEFIGNTGPTGGMLNTGGGKPSVMNCVFIGNRSLDLGAGGGGMSNLKVNTGYFGSSPAVTNCTFIGNSASSGGGILNRDKSHPIVTGALFWNNAGGSIEGDAATVSYSDVQGGYPGIGNIDADPLCDADGRPQAGSPCIDAGINNAVPADTLDLDNDGDTAERLPLDLDGNPRFADDPDRDDTGCGLPVVVDMGAFEYQGVPVETVIVGDVDGDGVVDFADLLDVLEGWGTCDVECCLADQDFNWVVDVREILMVLGNWG